MNIRSLLKISESGSRLDELKFFIDEKKISVLALTETHLSGVTDDDSIAIEGFNLFRKDRKKGAGGVAFYVRDDLLASRLDDLDIVGLESLWIQVRVNSKKFVFGVCYRPPNQSAEEIDFVINGLYSSFDLINTKYKSTLILQGDFNDRCIEWNSNHVNREVGLKLYDMFNSFGLCQLVNEPTRGRDPIHIGSCNFKWRKLGIKGESM